VYPNIKGGDVLIVLDQDFEKPDFEKNLNDFFNNLP